MQFLKNVANRPPEKILVIVILSHYRLSDTSSTSTVSSKKDSVRPKRSGLSEESKVAADAALARLQQKRENPTFNTSLAAIQVLCKFNMVRSA